ncbi:hypothetical protein [Halalkalicoccus subterraneus]|uniref:hypothetical protein n=1 Tax=Halalkalicoccus subterraneus TaxID=2675002 RepID=UPI000EFA8664|nr:hypothetical protein [Halalkalicoccus subterraneus]
MKRVFALVVGLMVVALLGLIPFLSGLVDLVVLLLGLGALVLALYGRYGEQADEQGEPTATV